VHAGRPAGAHAHKRSNQAPPPLPPQVAPDGIKPFGLTVDLDAAPDAVGVVTPGLGATGSFAPGQALVAAVVDVSKAEGIVDLALLPEVVKGAGGGGGGGKPAAAKPPKRKFKVRRPPVPAPAAPRAAPGRAAWRPQVLHGAAGARTVPST
jgi:hypothetical protein